MNTNPERSIEHMRFRYHGWLTIAMTTMLGALICIFHYRTFGSWWFVAVSALSLLMCHLLDRDIKKALEDQSHMFVISKKDWFRPDGK